MKDRTFENFGPFELPRNQLKSRVLHESLPEFWSKTVNSSPLGRPGLSHAKGCYIFAMKAARGFKPWYVGQTNRQSFEKEACQDHKLAQKYNPVIERYKSGTPVIFLIARMTPTRGDFSTRVSAREAKWLESHLISLAMEANTNLTNKRDHPIWAQINVPGLVNDKSRNLSQTTEHLHRLLNIKAIKKSGDGRDDIADLKRVSDEIRTQIAEMERLQQEVLFDERDAPRPDYWSLPAKNPEKEINEAQASNQSKRRSWFG